MREALPGIDGWASSVLFRVDELAPVDRALLHERHLVSKELAGLDAQHPLRTGAAVFLGDRLGVMVNEEDHLRLQALRSGFALQEAYGALDKLDHELGESAPVLVSRRVRIPDRVSDERRERGMRASVLIHLPGLVLTKEIGKVLAGLQQMGLTYRGLYGEGSEVVGNFFQISNQTTLGRSEEELLDQLLRVVASCHRA